MSNTHDQIDPESAGDIAVATADMDVDSVEPIRETGLAGFAQRLAGWTEKWFPDAFIFALLGVVIIFIGVFANGAKPKDVFLAVGTGFWDLLAFSLQMAMVVLTGYVVATSSPMKRFIEWCAKAPKSPRWAVGYVALISMAVSYISWGLSLVFAGLLARAIARRKDLKVDYKALGAAAFMGLGAVWALGISSSAAQLQNTPSSIPKDMYKITGWLPFSKTIFTWQAVVLTLILWALTVVISHFSAPRGDACVTAEMMGVDLSDEVELDEDANRKHRPGEWLEYKWYLPAFMGFLILGWTGFQFAEQYTKVHKGSIFWSLVEMMSNLNWYLMVFLVLGMVLHKTPKQFMNAVMKAVPATAGVLVQFPLYAVMAKLMTSPKGFGGYTLAHRLSDIFTGVGHDAFPIVLALYTAVLGILVPSGGGKWIVEAPYVMDASNRLGYNLGWTVEIYNVAEALPNLINPFFMLPLLSILKVRARDLVGYTFVQFLFHFPVILLLVWLLGRTFGYEAPVAHPSFPLPK